MMGNKNIKKVGCAMSSISMAMAAKGITINGKTADPSTLNNVRILTKFFNGF
jgi:hypothetical protein